MSESRRQARLAIEYTKLMNLADRSRFIKIDPVEVRPGWPPEKYVVTYTCRGIARINADDSPVPSNFHQVQMYLGREFPTHEPHLKWLTQIWHPNIQHEEPHQVCTNNLQNWFPAKPLVDLVVAMGEMVQYKWYLAEWKPPYPLDREVADWVIRYAQPKGLFSHERAYDRRPLLRTRMLRGAGQSPIPDQDGAKLRIGKIRPDAAGETAAAEAAPAPVAEAPAEPAPRGKMTFGGRRTSTT